MMSTSQTPSTVKAVEATRDDDGITLVFQRQKQLKKQKLTRLTEMPATVIEKRVIALSEVKKVVAIQDSSLTHSSPSASGSDSTGKRLVYPSGDDKLVKHPFIGASIESWSSHRGLVVSPDHFWLMLLQAVGEHVNLHAEDLRKKWVKHKGKKALSVVRNEFVVDQRDNDWAGVIEEFCRQIGENTVDDAMALLDGDFSTTSLVERAAAKATTMSIVKAYFDYIVWTLCGFPTVRMEGTVKDWEKLREKTQALLNSDKLLAPFAASWLDALMPVLDNLVLSAKGEPPLEFWDQMVKMEGVEGSGAYSYVSGWINVFLPIMDERENPMCFKSSYGIEDPPGSWFNLGRIPSGLCTTKLTWKYLKKKFPLQLLAGFFATSENDDGTLRPEVGWALVRTKR